MIDEIFKAYQNNKDFFYPVCVFHMHDCLEIYIRSNDSVDLVGTYYENHIIEYLYGVSIVNDDIDSMKPEDALLELCNVLIQLYEKEEEHCGYVADKLSFLSY